MTKRLQVAVIGSAWKEEYQKGWFNFNYINKLAYQLWRELAKNNAIVVNWWKTWIMEYVSKWVKEEEGTTVWVVKWDKRGASNSYIDVEVVSNIWTWGDALIIPTMSDLCIVIWWWAGTLKEMCWFYLLSKKIICMKWTWWRADKLADSFIDERKIIKTKWVESIQEAISEVKKII